MKRCSPASVRCVCVPHCAATVLCIRSPLPLCRSLTAQALHHSCKNDHVDVVAYLLDVGKALVAVEDDSGNTSLSLAARMGNLKCLELLSARGGSIDGGNKRGCTPFMAAVLNGRMAVIDWFLKKPININHADRDGNTALHYAAK
jgi:ankyrin repeat protein